MEATVVIFLIVAIACLVGYFIFLASRERRGAAQQADAVGAAQVAAAGISSGRVSQASLPEDVYYPAPRENEIPADLMFSYLFGVLGDGESKEMRRKLRERQCYYNPMDRSKPVKDFSINFSVELPDGSQAPPGSSL